MQEIVVWSTVALIRWTHFHGTETYKNPPISISKPDSAYRGGVVSSGFAEAEKTASEAGGVSG